MAVRAVGTFKAGHQVRFVNERKGGPNVGVIEELHSRTSARVKFSYPKRPKGGSWNGGFEDACESCGMIGLLSMGPGPSGKTEIVCMRSGCGHGHGREERTELIELSELINLTIADAQKKRIEYANEVRAVLDSGVKDGIITRGQAITSLKVLNLS